jgi:chromate transport protein ChrA
LGVFADSVYPVIPDNMPLGLGNVDWLGAFIAVVQGVVPIMLILIGLFIIWLETDELKAEKEIKKEEKKGKK